MATDDTSSLEVRIWHFPYFPLLGNERRSLAKHHFEGSVSETSTWVMASYTIRGDNRRVQEIKMIHSLLGVSFNNKTDAVSLQHTWLQPAGFTTCCWANLSLWRSSYLFRYAMESRCVAYLMRLFVRLIILKTEIKFFASKKYSGNTLPGTIQFYLYPEHKYYLVKRSHEYGLCRARHIFNRFNLQDVDKRRIQTGLDVGSYTVYFFNIALTFRFYWCYTIWWPHSGATVHVSPSELFLCLWNKSSMSLGRLR